MALILYGSSTLILVCRMEVSWNISFEWIVGSKSTKNRGSWFLLSLWRTWVTCLTLIKRVSNSVFIRSVGEDGCKLRITTRVDLSSFSWYVWNSAFSSLRKCTNFLYDSGLAFCILCRSIIDLQWKLSTPIRAISSVLRPGKSWTSLINIGGGGLTITYI